MKQQQIQTKHQFNTCDQKILRKREVIRTGKFTYYLQVRNWLIAWYVI